MWCSFTKMKWKPLKPPASRKTSPAGKQTEAKAELEKAVELWNYALKESDLKNKKARIDAKVTATTHLNCAEAYIWLNKELNTVIVEQKNRCNNNKMQAFTGFKQKRERFRLSLFCFLSDFLASKLYRFQDRLFCLQTLAFFRVACR